VANGLFRPLGRTKEALRYILKGILLTPWRLSYWKTLVGSALKQ